jgi:type I restriction enzyme S subunit
MKTFPTYAIVDFCDVHGGLQITHARTNLPIEVPYLRVANVHRDRLDLREIKRMRVTVAELERARLHSGDILVVEGHGDPEEVGRSAVWSTVLDSCVHQNHLICVRADRTRAVPAYVSAFLNSQIGRQQLICAGKTTSGLNTININNVRAVRVPLPPLHEQSRIADIFDRADAVRRKRKEAIALTEELLRSAFLEMFGDPVTNSKEWPQVPLGSIAEVNRGRFSPRPRNDPRYYDGHYPFIQTGDLRGSVGYLRDWRQTLNDDGTKVSRGFPKGTVAIAIAANIGDTALVDFDFYCPDSVVGIEVSPQKAAAEYVEMLLRFHQPKLIANAPETAQKNINLETLRPFQVIAPPRDLQGRFADVYRVTYKLAKRGAEALVHTNALFDSLVHRAFCGEL